MVPSEIKMFLEYLFDHFITITIFPVQQDQNTEFQDPLFKLSVHDIIYSIQGTIYCKVPFIVLYWIDKNKKNRIPQT